MPAIAASPAAAGAPLPTTGGKGPPGRRGGPRWPAVTLGRRLQSAIGVLGIGLIAVLAVNAGDSWRRYGTARQEAERIHAAGLLADALGTLMEERQATLQALAAATPDRGPVRRLRDRADRGLGAGLPAMVALAA